MLGAQIVHSIIGIITQLVIKLLAEIFIFELVVLNNLRPFKYGNRNVSGIVVIAIANNLVFEGTSYPLIKALTKQYKMPFSTGFIKHWIICHCQGIVSNLIKFL